MKILLIEDEKELALDIAKQFAQEHYLCEIASTYDIAIEKIHTYNYDCILLDLMLPGGDGLSVLKTLKALNRNEGVIIISAKNALEDKITGLQNGADDYLAKPFYVSELIARVHSLIRRKQFNSSDTIVQGELSINLNAKTLHINGQPVELTKKEYDLLVFLIGNKNKVLSKGALAEHLSGDLADMFDNYDFVYAHIKNLKRKLKTYSGIEYIKTVYGIGYRWEL